MTSVKGSCESGLKVARQLTLTSPCTSQVCRRRGWCCSLGWYHNRHHPPGRWRITRSLGSSRCVQGFLAAPMNRYSPSLSHSCRYGTHNSGDQGSPISLELGRLRAHLSSSQFGWRHRGNHFRQSWLVGGEGRDARKDEQNDAEEADLARPQVHRRAEDAWASEQTFA